MIDFGPPAGADLWPQVDPPVQPAVAPPRRRRRLVLALVAAGTILVIVAFAVFAFGVVSAGAAGGCGGP